MHVIAGMRHDFLQAKNISSTRNEKFIQSRTSNDHTVSLTMQRCTFSNILSLPITDVYTSWTVFFFFFFTLNFYAMPLDASMIKIIAHTSS